jgi:hypothetical protein
MSWPPAAPSLPWPTIRQFILINFNSVALTDGVTRKFL